MVAGGLSLAVAGCVDGSPPTADTNPARPEFVDEVLPLNRILGGADDFGKIEEFMVIDDRYMLLADGITDPHIAVLEIETGKVLTRFGRHGEGPQEFEAPHSFFPDPVRNDTWWVYDFANWQWTPVTMLGDITLWEIGDRYVLAGLPQVPETPMWIGEDEMVVHGAFLRFAVVRATVDENSRGVESWVSFDDPQPYTLEDMPHSTGLAFLNRSFAAKRPTGGFAVAYQFDNWIEIRDREGSLVRKMVGPREATPHYWVEGNRFHWGDDSESGYVDAYGTENSFYLLWQGAAGDDAWTIHHFDWSGDFIRELHVSDPLYSFAVSSNEDRLWGFLNQGIPYPGIGEWLLPEVEKQEWVRVEGNRMAFATQGYLAEGPPHPYEDASAMLVVYCAADMEQSSAALVVDEGPYIRLVEGEVTIASGVGNDKHLPQPIQWKSPPGGPTRAVLADSERPNLWVPLREGVFLTASIPSSAGTHIYRFDLDGIKDLCTTE